MNELPKMDSQYERMKNISQCFVCYYNIKKE